MKRIPQCWDCSVGSICSYVSMQGIRNNELLARTFETFSKSPIRPASSKITKENTNNRDKKNNSVKHLQRKQFSFTI